MPHLRFIGDVHGKYRAYKRLIADAPPSVQVGDMGVGFLSYPHGEAQSNPPFDAMVKANARFIRGNHDNPAVCLRHRQYISDGTVENGMMFVGGAYSADHALRIENFSWWPDEELSDAEFNRMFAIYAAAKPHTMVTHDCPREIALLIMNRGLPITLEESRTRAALQAMLAIHRPALWVFGHYHVAGDITRDGTRFVCLPELGHLDVEVGAA